jgi:GNAT superfamily N-acetyltransferase
LNLVIEDVDPQGADALSLLHEALIDARALYPELFLGGTKSPTNGPLVERGVYVVAYVDGRPLASGALRPISEAVAEVKRMYVHRDHRRQGLARAVLRHLQKEAVRLSARPRNGLQAVGRHRLVRSKRIQTHSAIWRACQRSHQRVL